MFIKYNIKRLFGYYKNKPLVWIKVIQTDSVEYFCEVNKDILKEEVKRLYQFAKNIKIL